MLHLHIGYTPHDEWLLSAYTTPLFALLGLLKYNTSQCDTCASVQHRYHILFHPVQIEEYWFQPRSTVKAGMQ
jgi:hypothetical protein